MDACFTLPATVFYQYDACKYKWRLSTNRRSGTMTAARHNSTARPAVSQAVSLNLSCTKCTPVYPAWRNRPALAPPYSPVHHHLPHSPSPSTSPRSPCISTARPGKPQQKCSLQLYTANPMQMQCQPCIHIYTCPVPSRPATRPMPQSPRLSSATPVSTDASRPNNSPHDPSHG